MKWKWITFVIICKRIAFVIIEAVLVAMIIAASIYSFVANRENFLNFSLAQALTLLVAICIAFNAVQYKGDERKRKEQIEKIVEKIQTMVSDPAFYSFDEHGDTKKVSLQIIMMCRKLSNCIEVLENYAKFYGMKEDAAYIREEYKTYKILVSGMKCDLKYLSSIEEALKKHAMNIDSKCDTIIVKIYK